MKRGYSLLELMIVIAITALCATLSIALIPAFTAYQLQAETDVLYQTCVYLKQQALLTGLPQTLNFNLAHNSYTYGTTTHTLPHPVVFGYMANSMGPPAHPHTNLSTACTFAKNSITFHPHGSIDAGTIYLTTTKKNRMAAVTIAVSEYAYIRRYVYNDGWRLR